MAISKNVTVNGNDYNILYIGAFLGSVIGINMLAGNKATYYYLLLVILGSMMMYSNKYNISLKTPDIMKG